MKAVVLTLLMVGVVGAACGREDVQAQDLPSTVDIALSDFTNLPDFGWAISAAPASVSAGRVAFQITNINTASDQEGLPDIPHDFVVIKSDLAPGSLPTHGPGSSVDLFKVDVVAASRALRSGEQATVPLSLDAGDYVLICSVKPFGVEASHYKQGMFMAFTVRDD